MQAIPEEVPKIVANNRMLTKRVPTDLTLRADVVTVDPDFVSAVAVQHGPIADIAADRGGAPVVVSNYADASVAVLNPATLALEGVVPVSGEPFSAAVADDRAYVAVTSASYDAVVVIDTNTNAVIAEYPLAFSVPALTVSPDGKRVYAARAGRDHVDVAVIDTTAERVGTIDVVRGAGISVDAVRVDPTGRRLYVATSDARGGRLHVVNTETARVVRTLAIAAPIRDFVLGRGGTCYALTSDLQHGGAVHVIDLAANAVADVVEIGGAPTQMVLNADATLAYVVDFDHVAVLCTLTNEVVDRIDVGAQPSGVALGAGLYIADYSGRVTMVSVASSLPMVYPGFAVPELITVPELPVLEPAAV